jgi:isomerase DpgB
VDRNVFTISVVSNAGLQELTEAVRSVLGQIYRDDQKDTVIVLRCASFADCPEGGETLQSISSWEKVLRQLEMANAITVFISEGDVFGRAFDLLLISDYRSVQATSRIGFSRRGRITRPGMSLYRLTNQLGQAQARRVGLAGKILTAQEAVGLGLADEVSDDASDMLDHFLNQLGETSSAGLAIQRRLILEAQAMEYDNALGAYLAVSAIERADAPA